MRYNESERLVSFSFHRDFRSLGPKASFFHQISVFRLFQFSSSEKTYINTVAGVQGLVVVFQFPSSKKTLLNVVVLIEEGEEKT